MKKVQHLLSIVIVLKIALVLTGCGAVAKIAFEAGEKLVKEAPGLVDDIAKRSADDLAEESDKIVREISDDSVSLARRILTPEEQAELHIKLKSIDEYTEAQNYATAISALNKLIQEYGEQPEIMVRLAIVRVSVGDLDKATQQIIRSQNLELPQADRFFTQVNDLIDDTPDKITKHNIVITAQAIEWKHWQAQELVPIGKYTGVGLRQEETILVLGHSLVSLASKEISESSTDEVSTSSIPVYVQSIPSFNTVDWSVSIERALNQLPEGELPQAIKLKDKGIAHFQPHVLLIGDERYILRTNRNSFRPGSGQLAGDSVFLLTESNNSNQILNGQNNDEP